MKRIAHTHTHTHTHTHWTEHCLLRKKKFPHSKDGGTHRSAVPVVLNQKHV